jgi:hypothetical protein
LKDDGDGALDPRELLEPLTLNTGALDRRLRVDPFERLLSFLSRTAGPDHSLSVVGELTDSTSMSPVLLVSPALVTEPEVRLIVDELALKSFSLHFSLSSKSIKMRERASLYAASRSAIVLCFLLLPVALLRPPWLPDSDGSTSESSGSSPAIEPACECGFDRPRSAIDRRMILIVGWVEGCAGTRAAMRRLGLYSTRMSYGTVM